MNDNELLAILKDSDAGLSPAEGYGPARKHVLSLLVERERLKIAAQRLLAGIKLVDQGSGGRSEILLVHELSALRDALIEETPMNDDPVVWVSPIDEHIHYDAANRVMCSVCNLQMERDALRVIARDLWAALWNADPASVELLNAEHQAMLPGMVRATMLAAVEHSKALSDERDRLQEDLRREREAVKPIIDQALHDAVTERDRLRAVVDAARRWYAAIDLEELEHAVGGLKAALDQLDASAETTDG